MRKLPTWILAATWELPQTLLALVLICVLHAKRLDGKGRVFLVHRRRILTCFSLGEFIFFDDWAPDDETVRHETGHSVQSRIFGPLYLLLIGLPSIVWNMLSRMRGSRGRWFSSRYYDTPWEHGADVLGKVERS